MKILKEFKLERVQDRHQERGENGDLTILLNVTFVTHPFINHTHTTHRPTQRLDAGWIILNINVWSLSDFGNNRSEFEGLYLSSGANYKFNEVFAFYSLLAGEDRLVV